MGACTDVGFVGLITLSAVAQNVADDQSSVPCECAPRGSRTCALTVGIWYMKPGGHFNPAKQEKNLSKLLKLTAEQQSQVRGVLKSAKAQLKAIGSDRSLSRSDRNCRVAHVREASNDQIRELLDKKQDAKLIWRETPPPLVYDFNQPEPTQ